MAFKLLLALAIINLVWSRPSDINVNVKVDIDVCCPGNCCPSQDQAAEHILLPHLTSTTSEVTTTTYRTTTAADTTTSTTDRTTKTTDRTTTTPDRTTTQDPCDTKNKGGCEQVCTKDGEKVICGCDDYENYSLQEDRKTCKPVRYNEYPGMYWIECTRNGVESFNSLAVCKQRCNEKPECTGLEFGHGDDAAANNTLLLAPSDGDDNYENECDLINCPVPATEPTEYHLGWTAYSKV